MRQDEHYLKCHLMRGVSVPRWPRVGTAPCGRRITGKDRDKYLEDQEKVQPNNAELSPMYSAVFTTHALQHQAHYHRIPCPPYPGPQTPRGEDTLSFILQISTPPVIPFSATYPLIPSSCHLSFDTVMTGSFPLWAHRHVVQELIGEQSGGGRSTGIPDSRSSCQPRPISTDPFGHHKHAIMKLMSQSRQRTSTTTQICCPSAHLPPSPITTIYRCSRNFRLSVAHRCGHASQPCALGMHEIPVAGGPSAHLPKMT